MDRRFLHTEPYIVHTYTYSLSHQIVKKSKLYSDLLSAGKDTLCKYATALVDTRRRNADLAGTPDAEKK